MFFYYMFLCITLIIPYLFSDQETPPSMLRLQALSNKGHGWLLVLHSMVNVIPINEPLGPAVITLVLDDCALPAKVRFNHMLDIVARLNFHYFFFRIPLLKSPGCFGCQLKLVKGEDQILIVTGIFVLHWAALLKNWLGLQVLLC
jgi:hypothetical protein